MAAAYVFPPIAGRSRDLAKGEALFRQGDPVTALFRVERGRMRLLRHTPSGAAVVLHTAREGEIFAEAALFSGVYHCDSLALEPTRVTAYAKADLLDHFAADRDALLAFAGSLARQVQRLRARIERRALKPAAERLVHFLLTENERNGTALKELAAELDLTPEALYRTVALLERKGRLVRKGGRLSLT
ncbi:MAG: Crp/Fnr family transcriptional regulator [Alphaproteobacteria bacterium]|nr:Crp/Fnr family transcriptional regulator [Alphaproteobacteria bacterium]